MHTQICKSNIMSFMPTTVLQSEKWIKTVEQFYIRLAPRKINTKKLKWRINVDYLVLFSCENFHLKKIIFQIRLKVLLDLKPFIKICNRLKIGYVGWNRLVSVLHLDFLHKFLYIDLMQLIKCFNITNKWPLLHQILVGYFIMLYSQSIYNNLLFLWGELIYS